MRWLCKNCDFGASKRLDLLKHYRLKHFHTGRGRSVPCLYTDCPCLFKSWGALRTHLSRDHIPAQGSKDIVLFSCLVCRPSSQSFHTERQYFEHLGTHLKIFKLFIVFSKVVPIALIYIQLLFCIKVGNTILTALKILKMK